MFKLAFCLICLLLGVLPAHLGGNTCYGDNVEDEWFIVALLMEVSKEFPDSIVR